MSQELEVHLSRRVIRHLGYLRLGQCLVSEPHQIKHPLAND